MCGTGAEVRGARLLAKLCRLLHQDIAAGLIGLHGGLVSSGHGFACGLFRSGGRIFGDGEGLCALLFEFLHQLLLLTRIVLRELERFLLGDIARKTSLSEHIAGRFGCGRLFCDGRAIAGDIETRTAFDLLHHQRDHVLFERCVEVVADHEFFQIALAGEFQLLSERAG